MIKKQWLNYINLEALMENFKQTYNYDNYFIKYNFDRDCYVPTTTITIAFNRERILTLSQWDDYGFEGYFHSKEEKNNLEFLIGRDNVLYELFIKFLGEERLIVIDDEETPGENNNVMIVMNADAGIEVRFITSPNIKRNNPDLFYVFIKNIGADSRSKITCREYDTKERLFDLFEGFRALLNPESLLTNPQRSIAQMEKENEKLKNSAGFDIKKRTLRPNNHFDFYY